MEILIVAIPSILSAITLGLLGYCAKRLKQFLQEHKLLMETERNDIKAQIVAIYEQAKTRGYITPMEIETLNRLYDSYVALGGNSYIEALMYDANHNIPIVGTSIPALVESVRVNKQNAAKVGPNVPRYQRLDLQHQGC